MNGKWELEKAKADGECTIRAPDGSLLCCFGSGHLERPEIASKMESQFVEIVRKLNALDGLLGACRGVLSTMEITPKEGQYTTSRDTGTIAELRDAIAAAEPEGGRMSDNFEPVVDWFSGIMKVKLGTKHNRAKPHWATSTFALLLERLRDEVQELENALCREDVANAVSECCDVANFAMMIADKLRQELYSEPEGDVSRETPQEPRRRRVGDNSKPDG